MKEIEAMDQNHEIRTLPCFAKMNTVHRRFIFGKLTLELHLPPPSLLSIWSSVLRYLYHIASNP